MQRTDRLFEIIRILRDGQLHRAQDMAIKLRVSVRTIYRDMDTLAASGVPVEGERGVGYIITQAISLPSFILTVDELEALQLGIAIVAETTDETLKSAASSLANKIDNLLPERTIEEANKWQFAIYPFASSVRGFSHMPILRAAIRAKQKLKLTYHSKENRITSRTIRPLHIEYCGRVWTLTAWCELREQFHIFRVDLIQFAEALPEMFVDEPGKRLKDYNLHL